MRSLQTHGASGEAHVRVPRGAYLRAALAVIAALLCAVPTTAESHPRRTRADYDGRRPPPAPVGQYLLSLPRVLLFPIYAVTEYGVRAPLGWLLSNVERHHVVARIKAFLQPTDNVFIAPTVLIDLGLLTSGGVYFAWSHALHRDNDLRLRGTTGGPGYWYFALTDRVAIGPRSQFVVKADYLERRDWRFYGLGPDTRQQDEQQFGWGRADGSVSVVTNAWQHLGVALTTGVRHDHFGDPPLHPVGTQALPVMEEMVSWYASARAFLDSRPLHRPNTTGARLEGAVEYGVQIDRHPLRRWIRYEIEGSVFFEVRRPGRVLGLHAFAAFADPVGPDSSVPLVNLVRLGGFETLRGWLVGRFWGESAAVFAASYRYPVWHSLDGAVFAEAGNTFDRQLAGFDVRHLYGSFGTGFRTTGDRDASFDILFALGTSRFDAPAFSIDSFRLAVGLNRGF